MSEGSWLLYKVVQAYASTEALRPSSQPLPGTTYSTHVVQDLIVVEVQGDWQTDRSWWAGCWSCWVWSGPVRAVMCLVIIPLSTWQRPSCRHEWPLAVQDLITLVYSCWPCTLHYVNVKYLFRVSDWLPLWRMMTLIVVMSWSALRTGGRSSPRYQRTSSSGLRSLTKMKQRRLLTS